MDERRRNQLDALQTLIKYSDGLIPALQKLIMELRMDLQDDTEDFLGEVINGINWEIEVYNQCSVMINERSSYIDKKNMIGAVKNLGVSLNSGNFDQIADCLEYDFLPFLNKLDLAAKMVVDSAQQNYI